MRCRPPIESLGLPILALLLLGGCTQQVYELEIMPDGDFIERKLTVYSQTTGADGEERISPLSSQERKRIHAFYDSQNDLIEGDKHTFVGRFRGQMPADIGGSGSYVRWQSPLGAAYYYSERFRGEDDLQRSIEHRYEAVDKLIDLLLRWSKDEVTDAATFKRVETFLDQELRHDLKNVALYCWSHAMLSDPGEKGTMQRLGARVMQYLMERDYLSLPELPIMLRAMNSGDEAAKLEVLREILIQKLSLDDDEALAILTDPEKLAQSLRRSIRRSEIYQAEFRKHRKERGIAESQAEAASEFDPLHLLIRYAFQATLPEFNSGHTGVRVSVHCGASPFFTNATWDDEEQLAQWRGSIDNINVAAMVYVAWSEPDTKTQHTHLGETVLSGENLANFVVWYQGLKPSEKQHFDDFLADLTPGDDLLGKIEAFALEGDDHFTERVHSLFRSALQ